MAEVKKSEVVLACGLFYGTVSTAEVIYTETHERRWVAAGCAVARKQATVPQTYIAYSESDYTD